MWNDQFDGILLEARIFGPTGMPHGKYDKLIIPHSVVDKIPDAAKV